MPMEPAVEWAVEIGSFAKMPVEKAVGWAVPNGQIRENAHETGSGGSSRPRQDGEGEGVAVAGGEGVDEFVEEELALDIFRHIIVRYIGFPFL
jgi:hypothetical protein